MLFVVSATREGSVLRIIWRFGERTIAGGAQIRSWRMCEGFNSVYTGLNALQQIARTIRWSQSFDRSFGRLIDSHPPFWEFKPDFS